VWPIASAPKSARDVWRAPALAAAARRSAPRGVDRRHRLAVIHSAAARSPAPLNVRTIASINPIAAGD